MKPETTGNGSPKAVAIAWLTRLAFEVVALAIVLGVLEGATVGVAINGAMGIVLIVRMFNFYKPATKK